MMKRTSTFWSLDILQRRPAFGKALKCYMITIYTENNLFWFNSWSTVSYYFKSYSSEFHTALIEFTVSLCRKPIERFRSRGKQLCYTNLLEKRNFLQKKKVQFPQDWFETPTWPPFYWFGTRHVAKLYTTITQTTSHLLILCRVWTFPAHLPKHTMNQVLYNYKVGFKQLFKKYRNTTLQYTSLLRENRRLVGLFKNLWESSAVEIAAKMYQLRI